MSEVRGLRLSASAAVKERRLQSLLAERGPDDPALRECVEDAQLLGSLDLAGFSVTWDEVRASRRGGPAPPSVAWLRAAQRAVEPAVPLSVEALLTWHRAATGGTAGLRRAERERTDGPPPAPAPFVASRLAILEQWMGVDSAGEIKAAQQGALVLARVVEILPFEDANGRVSRLAASHVMVRAGARPPILVRGDRPRLEQALQAAFQLATEPLATLLEEASGRALDVMIQTLEAGEP
ncbi:MAG: Fic family protein [Acidobacteria bacterium]|nr:Fic family protein [Acidobacteriota bacterium]